MKPVYVLTILTFALLSACGGGGSSTTGTTTTPTITATDTTTSTALYDIVDTNQSTCYSSSTGSSVTCDNSGYDADYNGNQPSYTVSGDGLTVADNITGLTWTQSTDIDGSGQVDYDDKRSPADAATYCSGLTLGSFSDWRLPNIKESYSLILFSGKDASNYAGSDTSTLTPFIHSTFDYAFGDTTTANGIAAGDRIIDGQYASSTDYVSTTMTGSATTFGVNYVDGRIKGYPTNVKKFYVRCVRGNTSYGTNSFTDNTDQTVSDAATGLMWQQDDSSSSDWDNAVSTCEASSTASHTDWRLPNAKELQSIVDYTRSPDTSNYAAIENTFFTASSIVNEEAVTDWGYYWSSTTHVNNDSNGTNAAYVSFGRALGYFNGGAGLQVLDVHGAGSQRSNDKLDVAGEAGASSVDVGNGTFYYHGPQGDILRLDNKVRCVRNI
ncbi:DUF1566 domain-containing protein [Pseudomonadota bacterium]